MDKLPNKQKGAVLTAYRSNNNDLFEMTCNTLQIPIDTAVSYCIEQDKSEFITKYSKLSFNTKKGIKTHYNLLKCEKISKQQFVDEVNLLWSEFDDSKLDLSLDLIAHDKASDFPNIQLYQQSLGTARPQFMRGILREICPNRRDVADFAMKREIVFTMYHEISKKINNYTELISQEYTFRLNEKTFIKKYDHELDKHFMVKAQKIQSLSSILNHINKQNNNRDLNLRCDDMITVEMYLKQFESSLQYRKRKIIQRACDLGIAEKDGDDIKIKIIVKVFNSVTPQSTFDQYQSMLFNIQKRLNDVNKWKVKLEQVEVTNLLGNVTKVKRSKIAKKVRKSNTKSVSKKRTNIEKNANKETHILSVINKKELQLSRDIYSFDISISIPNITIREFPAKVQSVVNGYINLNTKGALPFYLKLFLLCYVCYGDKDQCEECKCDIGSMCDKCIRFVCDKCTCCHGQNKLLL